MEKPLVSVIIPIYNVEKYIASCVESVLAQTYENLEILLVNDGSTDNSESVCRELLARDNRLAYYKKPNGGLSDARNYGIDRAQGEYLMFLDSDDLLAPESIAFLYDALTKANASMAGFNLAHFTDGETPVFEKETARQVFSNVQALESFLYQKEITTSSCGKLYQAGLWNGVRFPVGKRFEDNAALYKVLYSCSCVVNSDARYYGYRHHKGSITTAVFSGKDLDILDIGEEIDAYLQDKEACLQEAVRAYRCNNCLRVYLTASEEPQFAEAVQGCVAYLRQNAPQVLNNPHIRPKLKLALWLFRLGVPRWVLTSMHRKARRWN